MRYIALNVALVLLMSAWAVAAQPSPGRGAKPRAKPAPTPAPAPARSPARTGNTGVWVSGSGSSYHPTTTPEESAARGLSDTIRASGEANLSNSQAAKNYEDARRKEMENRVYGTEAYFEMQKINKDARQANASPAASAEDLTRYAKESAPKRLSPSDLDPVTGAIRWPPTLQLAPYRKDRQQLESLFSQRARAGQFTAEQRLDVDRLVRSVQAELKKNIDAYPPQDFVQAKKFLDQLAYELYPASK